MRCSRCGHDNPDPYRYCGMCGTPLGRTGRQSEEEAAPAAPPRSPISGPSFLGLNEPANPGYLLEDEPRSHRGLWALLLLLLVAVLAGFQFRSELRARASKVYAAAWARFRYQQPSAQAQPPTAAQLPVQEPTAVTPPPETAAPAAQPPAPPSPVNKTEAQLPSQSQPSKSNEAEAKPEDKKKDQDKDEESAEAEEEAGNEVPAKSEEKRAVEEPRKPAARTESLASINDPMLVQARKYLHGQGVPQDCQQGLVYLRQALKKPNPAARSQMGALYATGHCVSQDRAAAYRWFSSALELEPGNIWLVRERDRLYGEMSSAERQRVDRNF